MKKQNDDDPSGKRNNDEMVLHSHRKRHIVIMDIERLEYVEQENICIPFPRLDSPLLSSLLLSQPSKFRFSFSFLLNFLSVQAQVATLCKFDSLSELEAKNVLYRPPFHVLLPLDNVICYAERFERFQRAWKSLEHSGNFF